MEIAITQGTAIIVGGDWNNQTSKIRKMTTKFGLKNSEVGSTRPRGKKEIDILATNLGTPVYSKAYNEDWMSDYYLVERIIKCQTNCETKKIKRITKSNVLKQNKNTNIIKIMHQSCSVDEIRFFLKFPKMLNKQYKNLDTQADMLIYARMLKVDIPIISLENKIKRALEKDKENINEELWRITSRYKDDMKRAESYFLQGIKVGSSITFEQNKILKEEIAYYSEKFKENNEIRNNNISKINKMFAKYWKFDTIKGIINIESILKEVEKSPIHTTYGYDLIIPAMLKQNEVKENIAKFTIDNLKKKKFNIQNSMLTGRLILMTKTRSPIANVNKTRPIAVQIQPIRLIEKVIKSKLEWCTEWENMKLNKYQVGFQVEMGTLVNLLRVKKLIKYAKKRRKMNRSILFALDIAAAFDKVSRELMLKAIQKKIDNSETKGWEKWASVLAFSSLLLKDRKVIYIKKIITIR